MNYSNPIEHLYQEELYNLRDKVIVIIPAAWDGLTEADQLLLAKILGSVKRTLASVQVLAMATAQITDLLIYKPSRIIAFGSVVQVPGEIIHPYKTYQHNQISILLADSLGELDDARKKNLWNALKGMFQV